MTQMWEHYKFQERKALSHISQIVIIKRSLLPKKSLVVNQTFLVPVLGRIQLLYQVYFRTNINITQIQIVFKKIQILNLKKIYADFTTTN